MKRTRIITIATRDWIDGHLERWIRLAKSSNPGAWFGLVLVSDDAMEGHPVIRDFDKVVRFDEKENCRDFYNVVRMGATRIFGVDEVMYCDCDADILEGLEGSEVDVSGADLMWTRSPTASIEWVEYAKRCGYRDLVMANNNLLYLRRDFSEDYKRELEVVTVAGLSPRLRGTYAFNRLIRSGVKGEALPDCWNVIWWDSPKFLGAKVVQYCNDMGQAKRLELEREWRSACG
jgi:hypothetical protein